MRTHRLLLALPLTLVVACTDSSPGDGAGTGGSTMTAGGATSGGAPAGGTSSGRGGSTSGSAGTASGVGGAASGAAGSAGSTNAGPGGTASGASGSGGGAGRGGTSGGGSAGMGGIDEPLGGAGGTPAAGSGNPGGMGGNAMAGTGNTAGCTRELLQSATDAYFVALAAGEPSTLPLADDVKFTENGAEMELGEGLWENAGALVHKHSALDTETCNAVSQAVVPDGSTDIPLTLRLKLVGGMITEIETIAVRAGDYSLASNTGALSASADSVGWEDVVPEGERNTREEITAWMDKYFREFPNGVCNVTSGCKRIENGGGNFNCTAGAMCVAGAPSGSPVYTPRLILVDMERGLGVGFTMFMTYTDAHLFKMFGDEIHGVSAILGSAGNSGWD